MMNSYKDIRKTKKYFMYTLCYWGVIGPLIYYISSKGLFSGGHSDAIWQHYPIMVYIRRFWINFFTSLINRQNFVVPMIDFTIGMGENTISALNYYGFGDPFYLLTVFASEENLPYFYSFFFYFRVYLGGIAFIIFASELNNTKSIFAYVIGALVYSFTGFTVQCNMHIIFTHAMLYTPLMLLGAEKSLHEKKKGLLCATTFCFALSGFFFLYIASISLAVYVVYRILREKRKLADAVDRICKLIIEYVLGLGLAAVIFVPAVHGFLSSNRAQIKSGFPLISSWDTIKDILLNMFQPSYENIGQETAVCTIGMIVIICILLSKGRIQEKINLGLLFLTVVIPFVSYFMAGFGRSSTRWQLVIGMYIAFLTVIFWDELEHISMFQKTGVVLVYLLLIIIGKKNDILAHERFGETIVSYGIILGIVIIALPLLKKMRREKMGRYILFWAVYITICSNWKAIARDNDIKELQLRPVFEELTDNAGLEDFYRVDDDRGRQKMNISLQQGYHGTMQYISVANKHYVNAFEKWDISNATHMTWYGFDQRTILETMRAVKYFIVNAENDRIIPYGFEYVKSTKDGEWSLYQNNYELPIAYTYEKVYDINDYKKMSGIERQQIMLQAAAIEKNTVSGYCESEIDNNLYTGTYEIVDWNNMTFENGVIKGEANSTITILADIKSCGENYLFYTGEVNGIKKIEIGDSFVKEGHPLSPLVINLGTAKNDEKVEIKITFNKAVELNINNLQIMYHDLSKYEEYIDALKEDTDGKFKVEANNINGILQLKQDKILCFSVPYSLGWHAKMDGKEVEIYPVNDLFMGIEVPKGVHEIEMYYVTPGIKAGAAVSIVSLIIIIFLVIRRTDKFKFVQ